MGEEAKAVRLAREAHNRRLSRRAKSSNQRLSMTCAKQLLTLSTENGEMQTTETTIPTSNTNPAVASVVASVAASVGAQPPPIVPLVTQPIPLPPVVVSTEQQQVTEPEKPQNPEHQPQPQPVPVPPPVTAPTPQPKPP